MTHAFGVISLEDWVLELWFLNLRVKFAKQEVIVSIIFITSPILDSTSPPFDCLRFPLQFLCPLDLWELPSFNTRSLWQFVLVCVRTYVFHLLGIYNNILCNWLILWQNALYLYFGKSMMFLILQETRFQDQVLKLSSLSKKTRDRKSVV